MSKYFQQYDVVRVRAIRGDRFSGASVHDERLPEVGDVGTVLEVYSTPEVGYEVECCAPGTGYTVWLLAMYPDELELVEQPN